MSWAQRGLQALMLVSGFLLLPLLHAAYVVGPPRWGTSSVQTTGGITYFSHTATLDSCNYTTANYEGISGNTLTMYAAEMQGEICTYCFECTYVENGVTVLGSFPPGDYTMNIFAPSPLGGHGRYLYRTGTFQVSADSTPTLKISKGPSAGQLVVDVTGHEWANYTLQSSDDLTIWKTMITRSGAPCSFQISPSATQKFFRVQISNGPN